VSKLEVVTLPTPDVRDVPKMLRTLADDIEAGKYDAAHNLAWALDTGNGKVEVGLMGQAAETAAVAYLLFGLAQHKIAADVKDYA